jgi:outer membrane protein insertion porin family
VKSIGSNHNLRQVFESLRKQIDPQVEEERERAVRERIQAQVEKAQQRLAELVRTATTWI